METLNASNYIYSVAIYRAEFETVLLKIVLCYNMMIKDNVSLPRDENGIRNTLLLDYLKNDFVRQEVGLLEFNFEREVPEDHSIGRTDIKIITQKTFVKQKEYYIIECKLIDNKNATGKTSLNAKYVANGICRFTTRYYHSSSDNVNGMIGFVISEIDIDKNIENINYLQTVELKNSNNVSVHPNTIKFITKTTFVEGYPYQYISEHKKDDGSEIRLYHLMLDCSKRMVA